MVSIFKDNETGQEIGRIFDTILDTASVNETYRRLAPIYNPDAFPGSQNFETFLVSIKRQGKHFLTQFLNSTTYGVKYTLMKRLLYSSIPTLLILS